MYKYISEYLIEQYDGRPLKEIVDGKIIRIITNPTEAQLREFGYKNLVTTEPPEERPGYYLVKYYIDGETEITEAWRYVEIPPVVEE